MEKENGKPMIDGKERLLTFARGFHARHEHGIVDLERLLRRCGVEVTDISNDDWIALYFVHLRTSTHCRTMVRYGGEVRIRHSELIRALERLTQTGVPTWMDELTQFEWHCQQLELCAPFEIPVPEEFQTRQELESHLESCATCQPANKLLNEAISLGSSRYTDGHMRELIQKSHEDQVGAVRFYESIRDSQRSPYVFAEKPQRTQKKGQEVTA